MRIREIVVNIATFAIAAIVIAGALEAYVATFADDGMQYDLEMWKYARNVKQVSDNPRIGHEHRPNAEAHLMGVDVRTNSHGHRDREFELENAPGRLRIMMIGDSLTFGWGVPQDRTFSKVVEARLRDGGAEVEVINTGVGNYNTIMEVETFLASGQRFRPDIVILNYFINDAERIPSYDYSLLERYSRAWAFFASRFDIAGRQMGFGSNTGWREYYEGLYDEAINPGGWRGAAEAIRRLAAYCRENGIELLIVQHPELRVLSPYPFGEQAARVADLAADLGLPYLDLLDSVRGEDPASLWVTVPDPHPNEKANRLFGEAIYAWLKDRGLAQGGAAPKGEGRQKDATE